MLITNTLPTFVTLWQQLEHTRQMLAAQNRRFCLRSVIKSWLRSGFIDPPTPLDDLIWLVCLHASRPGSEVYGMTQLPPPSTHPRVHREILVALVMHLLGIGKQTLNTSALDEAYHIAFPQSTPLNISKKKRLNKVAPPPS